MWFYRTIEHLWQPTSHNSSVPDESTSRLFPHNLLPRSMRQRSPAAHHRVDLQVSCTARGEQCQAHSHRVTATGPLPQSTCTEIASESLRGNVSYSDCPAPPRTMACHTSAGVSPLSVSETKSHTTTRPHRHSSVTAAFLLQLHRGYSREPAQDRQWLHLRPSGHVPSKTHRAQCGDCRGDAAGPRSAGEESG